MKKRILYCGILCLCILVFSVLGFWGNIKKENSHSYEGKEENEGQTWNTYEKQAKELFDSYIPGFQMDELYAGFFELYGDENLDCCMGFYGHVLNGISDIWNEDIMWISKINVRPFFHAWVEQGEIKTDYPSWLFSSVFYLEMEQGIEEGKWDYCMDVQMPSYSQMAYPYYPLLAEPLVLVSTMPAEEIEPIFKAAYEKMHEEQQNTEKDLTIQIRFGDHFDPWNDYAKYLPEEDYEDTTEWMHAMAVEGYYNWEEAVGDFFPVHEISFYLPYEEGGAKVFAEMIKDREKYLKGEEQGENEEEEKQEDSDNIIYTVKEGDTLWSISLQVYGEGSRWREIYEKNREEIGDNPDIIFGGMSLIVPE